MNNPKLDKIILPVKVQKLYRLVIPKEVRENFNIKEGDKYILEATSGTLIFRVMK